MDLNFNQIARNLSESGNLNKTDIMASILAMIIKDCKIRKNQYMIIAGYCLRDYRIVGDLDVMLTENAYEKIKAAPYIHLGKAKISGSERGILRLPALGEEAEIEFFARKPHDGFPTEEFSIEKLKKNKRLLLDGFGNPYYNLQTCIEQYSCVKKLDSEYFIGKFKIPAARVQKNINHLKTIREAMGRKVPKYLIAAIAYLEKIGRAHV